MPSFELSDELVREILITNLTQDYERTSGEVARLKEIKKSEGLLPFQMEDLQYSRQVKKAAKRLLKYYGADV